MNEHKQFLKILDEEKIYTVFQPVVNLSDGIILGYEALSRGPVGSNYESPLKLIETAKKHNKLWNLETIFRKKAIKAYSQFNPHTLLFLNVDPNVIYDPIFKEGFTYNYIKEFGIKPQQIVFEILEHSAIEDYTAFNSAVEHYLKQGYKIAIDDFGAGYSNLSSLSKINPYYIKIDKAIVKDIDKDVYKQAIIKSFVMLANLTNTKTIAEGIETFDELKTLIRFGVHAGQGYLLSRPNRVPQKISSEIISLIENTYKSSQITDRYVSRYIGHICEKVPAYSINTTCIDIRNIFLNNKYEGICLLDKGNVSGLIMKTHLNTALSSQYGHALFAKKSISKLMDKSCLIVDYFTPVNTVSELAMSRPINNLYDNIIVTKNFEYFGIVSILKLLQYSIEIEKTFAKELNPLTGLPGNTQINQLLLRLTQQENQTGILYIDLDNFKSYNDKYGFELGDTIIKMTSNCICENVNIINSDISFTGHIGGDDFIVAVQCDYNTFKELSCNIVSSFANNISEFFTDEDKTNGYINSVGRDKKNKNHPLTSISVAGILGNLSRYNSPQEIAQHMSSLKKKAKEKEGNSYIIEIV